MMRMNALLLLSVALACFFSSSQGLAFVASSMRTRTVGPAASLTAIGMPLGRRNQAAHSYLTLNAGDKSVNDMPVASSSSDSFEFGDEADSTIQALRSEMVDLVYQMSLERLNGFDNE